MPNHTTIKTIKSTKLSKQLKRLCEETLLTAEGEEILVVKFERLTNAMLLLAERLLAFSKLLVVHRVPIDDSLVNFALLLHRQYFKSYDALKESDAYIQIMRTCVTFKDLFEKFEIKCINDEVNIQIFAWSDFDFKSIMIYVDDPVNRNALFDELKTIKNVLDTFVFEAFEPSVNISKVVKLVNEAFDNMEKKLDRCRDAFAILRSSLGILEDNYEAYYKEAILTGNSMSFLESFKRAIANNPVLQKRRKKCNLQMQFNMILNLLDTSIIQNMDKLNPEIKAVISSLLKQSC